MKSSTSSDQHISMTFRCNVKEDQLSETACGHFCHQCEKNVVDFRRYSQEEIRQYVRTNGAACGTFTSSQVDPNYIRPIAPGNQLRSLAFLSGLFVLVGGANSYAQTTLDPKKEESQGSSNAPNFTQEEAQQKGTPVSMSIGEEETESSLKTADQAREVPKTKQRRYLWGRNNRWYLSRKFPFVKKERTWRGKF